MRRISRDSPRCFDDKFQQSGSPTHLETCSAKTETLLMS